MRPPTKGSAEGGSGNSLLLLPDETQRALLAVCHEADSEEAQDHRIIIVHVESSGTAPTFTCMSTEASVRNVQQMRPPRSRLKPSEPAR
jgi:hypothetical protein